MSELTTEPSCDTPLGEPPRLGARGVARIEAKLFPRARPHELGRYVMGERLGAGAHGRVYRAYDPQLKRSIAIKEMAIDPTRSLARLEREAQTLAGLSHPNVVQIFESGRVSDDRYFIAMEFVEGTQLGRWLRAESRSHDTIFDVFAQLADGLSAIHRKGIVHRDFKPANVLLNNEGIPKIVDFGLAKRVGMVPRDPSSTTSIPSMSLSDTSADSKTDPKAASSSLASGRTDSRCSADVVEAHTPTTADAQSGGFRCAVAEERVDAVVEPKSGRADQTREFVGTPKYASPEQFLGVRAQPASDQFSFFVALFEALVGCHPFDGRNYAELGQLVVASEVKWPVRMSRPLRRLLERGLAAKPSGRHASMADVAAALRELRSPPVRSRALPWVLSAGVTAAVITWAAASPTDCARAADEQRERWATQRASLDTAHRDRGLAAFGELTLTEFDRYVERWADTRSAACQANEAGEDETEQVIACLDERFASFEVLTGVLKTEVERVQLSSTLAPLRSGVWLSPPERCATNPHDAREDVDVEAFAADLARIRVLFAMGDWDAAASVASDTYARAKELGARGPATVARSQHAMIQLLRGESELGRQELRASLLEAEALERPLLVAEIQSALATDLAEEGEEAAGVLVESALARVRAAGLANSNVEALILAAAGSVHTYLEAYDLAARRNREAAAAFETLFGADDPRRAKAQTNLAVALSLAGDLDEAADEATAAWTTLKDRLGVEHPLTLAHSVSVGIVLVRAGRHDEAIEILGLAANNPEPTLPRLIRKRTSAVVETAYVLTTEGHPAQAVPLLESVAPDPVAPAANIDSLRWADVAVFTYGTLEDWPKAIAAARTQIYLAREPATYDPSLVAKAALRAILFLRQDGRACEALEVASQHRDMIDRHQPEAAARILEPLFDAPPDCQDQAP